jgi:hypothetical protein
MPDFDVDFCMEGRDRVIEYVAKYGRERVSQIITYGTRPPRPWFAMSAGCSGTTMATSTRSPS